MNPEKTLYLHIGCGKTGSSALQVWLNNEAGALARQGVHYPLFGSKKLDAYAITSGNGMKLMQALQSAELAELMAELAQTRHNKILLSSEHFQGFTDVVMGDLKSRAAEHGMRVVVIAYMRDVYDIVYSSYLQLVKRHLGDMTFREFGLSRKVIQQFEVVRKYQRHFATDDIKVIHYDTHRERGLEVALCEAIGIDIGDVPRMADMKVNRSLDVFESEVLRVANKHYSQFYGKEHAAASPFSTRVSDPLIYADPEKETEILLDEDVLAHLTQLSQAAIDEVNETFLSATPLAMFNPRGKKVVREVPPLPSTYEILIGAVITYMAGAGAAVQPKPQRVKPGGGSAELKCTDPEFVNALRDEAVRVEKDDLAKAFALMTAAAALRPQGNFIVKKLEEYRAQLA